MPPAKRKAAKAKAPAVVLVSPRGVEVVPATPAEAVNLLAQGYRHKGDGDPLDAAAAAAQNTPEAADEASHPSPTA